MNTQPEINTPEQFWSKHLQLKQGTELSRAAYCRKYGLSYHKFGYWERKLSQQPAEPTQFMPIKLNSDNKRPTHFLLPSLLCTLTLKNGNELKIHDQTILPLLLSVLG